MKKGLLSLLLLISIAGFSQSTTDIGHLPRKNAASLGDTIISQNGHTYQYTIQQLYDLIAGNFLTTADLTSYEQSSHATATFATKTALNNYLLSSDAASTYQPIGSYLTTTTGDARYSLLAHTHTFASLTSKPTTIVGYGITDAYPLTGNPSGFLISSDIAGKQNTLVSGTTIKTINGIPLLGSGDITITGGGGGTSATDIEITDATKGVILKSPNGTRYRITVNNDGSLTTTSL